MVSVSTMRNKNGDVLMKELDHALPPHTSTTSWTTQMIMYIKTSFFIGLGISDSDKSIRDVMPYYYISSSSFGKYR
jgi:hypothetical protein